MILWSINVGEGDFKATFGVNNTLSPIYRASAAAVIGSQKLNKFMSWLVCYSMSVLDN